MWCENVEYGLEGFIFVGPKPMPGYKFKRGAPPGPRMRSPVAANVP